MIKIKINGQDQAWDGDPDLPLLWLLRDEIGLTGTKFGCGQALCGACTVIVDKQAVRACVTSVSDVADREVTTVEGLHPTGDHPVQKAWRQVNVPQCGYCQSGQIMQAVALPRSRAATPSRLSGKMVPTPATIQSLTASRRSEIRQSGHPINPIPSSNGAIRNAFNPRSKVRQSWA
ncbi:aerobic-type carbon monoxide dehydrogenase small subunit (CoxS/CutS family) [Nitrobacteraceae bacterium AZCC 2161]